MIPTFKLKTRNSDFQVFESYAVDQEMVTHGKYQYCLLFKSGISTFDAVDALTCSLGLAPNQVTYYGLKDEDAYTQQLISIDISESKLKDNIELINKNSFNSRNHFFRIIFLYSSSSPLVIGSLMGNNFLITLRDLSEDIAYKLKNIKKDLNFSIINYYGHQRFGLPDQMPTTHEIGRFILEKNYQEAIELISKQHSPLGNKALDHKENPEIFFSKLDIRKKNFFINSHFSYLWNQEIISLISKNIENYDEYLDNKFRLIFLKNKNNFIELIKDNPIYMNKIQPENEKLQIQKNSREIIYNINFKIYKIEDDEIFKGKYSTTLSFFLPSGCYATIVIPQFLHQVVLNG